MRRSYRILICAVLALYPLLAARAGLLSEGTRVIYPANSPGQRLTISNTNPWPVLVQTWVDRGEGELDAAAAPFVVIPAIFRLEPSASQSLHIISTGVALANDRESLFWLNLYEIPPTAREGAAEGKGGAEGEARLTLTLNTQLKLFYRPEQMGVSDTLASELQFKPAQEDGHACIHAHNPTPWYASLSALWVQGEAGPMPVDAVELLLPPFSARCYRLPGTPGAQASLHFGWIDDAGFSHEHSRP